MAKQDRIKEKDPAKRVNPITRSAHSTYRENAIRTLAKAKEHERLTERDYEWIQIDEKTKVRRKRTLIQSEKK